MRGRKFIKTDQAVDTRLLNFNFNDYPHRTRYIADLTSEHEPSVTDIYICQSHNKEKMVVNLVYKDMCQDKFPEKYKSAGFSTSLKLGTGSKFSFVIFIKDQNEWQKLIKLMKEVYELAPQTETELLAIKCLQEVKMSELLALLPAQFDQALGLAKIAADRHLLLHLGQHCQQVFVSQLQPATPGMQPSFNQAYSQMAISCFEEIEADHEDYKAARTAGYELLSLDEIKSTYDDEISYWEDVFRFAIDANLGEQLETVVDHIYKKLCGQSQRALSNVGKDTETLISSARHIRKIEAEKYELKKANEQLQKEMQKLQEEIAKLKQPVVDNSSSSPSLFKK